MNLDYNITYRARNNGLQAIISYKDGLKWKQKSKQGFENSKKGEKEAKKWVLNTLTTLEEDLKKENNEYDDITFKEFYEMYMEDRKPTITDNTYRIIKTSYNKFKDLDNIYMKNICTMDIQRCINKLVGYKSNTVKLYLTRIYTMFEYAINKYNILSKNPVKNIEYKKTECTKKTALSKKEIDDLLDKIKNSKSKNNYLIVLIAVKCGLRIGEIIGLTWDCVDLKNNKLIVNKQFNLKDDIYQFCQLKSKNSYREVPFSNAVKKEIINYRNKYPVNIDNRIFDNKDTSVVANNIRTTCRIAGYKISAHELRHTYATNLIANGVDFKTAAMLLGHDIEQTMKTYSHVTDDMINNARKIINNI
jgi:integrase